MFAFKSFSLYLNYLYVFIVHIYLHTHIYLYIHYAHVHMYTCAHTRTHACTWYTGTCTIIIIFQFSVRYNKRYGNFLVVGFVILCSLILLGVLDFLGLCYLIKRSNFTNEYIPIFICFISFYIYIYFFGGGGNTNFGSHDLLELLLPF